MLQPQQRGIWATSCTTACGKRWILNPLREARDQTGVLRDSSWVLNLLSHSGNSPGQFGQTSNLLSKPVVPTSEFFSRTFLPPRFHQHTPNPDPHYLIWSFEAGVSLASPGRDFHFMLFFRSAPVTAPVYHPKCSLLLAKLFHTLWSAFKSSVWALKVNVITFNSTTADWTECLLGVVLKWREHSSPQRVCSPHFL